VKAMLNPLIERVASRVFAVDQYADIFEKIAHLHHARPMLRRLCRRQLPDDVAAAPLLFIHVPKNGGTSIKQALYVSDPGHATVRFYDLFVPEHLARMPTMAILRDPVDRFLSGFDFLLNGGGSDVRILPQAMQRMAGIRTIDALLDFLEGAAGDWLKVDTFVRPQSWYVTDIEERIRIRHLWLIEETGDAMATFLAGHGVAAVPHTNRTARQNRTLTPDQRQRLQRLYGDDFALYARVKALGGYTDALWGVPLGALASALSSD